MSYVHPCLGKNISHLSNDEKNLRERLGYVTKTTQLAAHGNFKIQLLTLSGFSQVPCHGPTVGFDHCSFDGGASP